MISDYATYTVKLDANEANAIYARDKKALILHTTLASYQRGDHLKFEVYDDPTVMLSTRQWTHVLDQKEARITYVEAYHGLAPGRVALSIELMETEQSNDTE